MSQLLDKHGKPIQDKQVKEKSRHCVPHVLTFDENNQVVEYQSSQQASQQEKSDS